MVKMEKETHKVMFFDMPEIRIGTKKQIRDNLVKNGYREHFEWWFIK